MSKRKISYVQQEEPSFIKQFKAKVGFKEGPNIDTKRAKLPENYSDGDHSDTEDDKPQVVVLKPGDLSASEAEKLGFNSTEEEDTPLSRYAGPVQKDNENMNEGRVMFKKPVKKSAADPLNVSSKKEKSSSGTEEALSKKKGKKLANTKLLSFGDDEDE